MSDPFIAEIKIVGFDFPPRGWAFCSGQILSISQNQALFSLLGTTYGGNGQTTFALPNLQGRTPVHFDNSTIVLGQAAGEENHTLIASEMPAHSHQVKIVNADGANTPPTAPSISKSKIEQRFSTVSPGSVAMNPGSVSNSGGGQAHNNMQPSLVLNYCIALQGIFPSRS